MPRRKEAERFARVGEKDAWHLYALQMLSADKFANVVGKIIRGRYTLISTRMTTRAGM